MIGTNQCFEPNTLDQAPVVRRADNFIQWIKCTATNTFLRWIATYSVAKIIHSLNNWGQMGKTMYKATTTVSSIIGILLSTTCLYRLKPGFWFRILHLPDNALSNAYYFPSKHAFSCSGNFEKNETPRMYFSLANCFLLPDCRSIHYLLQGARRHFIAH